MIKSELRVEEYRARALEASAAAAGATLANTRELHQNAAAIWTEMADRELARAAKALAAMRLTALATADTTAEPQQ